MSDLTIAAGPDIAQRLEQVTRRESVSQSTGQEPGVARQATDSVELSDQARLLSRLRDLPQVRTDLVQRAREGIAAGEYDQLELPDDVLNRIVEDIDLFA